MSTYTGKNCNACGRVTETHAPGCSLVACPNRRPQVWTPPDGAQGFPGVLAEDRAMQQPAKAAAKKGAKRNG